MQDASILGELKIKYIQQFVLNWLLETVAIFHSHDKREVGGGSHSGFPG